MTNYHTTISGTKTLGNIERAIRGEELLASTFLTSQLAPVDGVITNLLTFAEQNSIPKPVRLVLQGNAIPAKHVQVWSGVMLVAGANTAVSVYRQK